MAELYIVSDPVDPESLFDQAKTKEPLEVADTLLASLGREAIAITCRELYVFDERDGDTVQNIEPHGKISGVYAGMEEVIVRRPFDQQSGSTVSLPRCAVVATFYTSHGSADIPDELSLKMQRYDTSCASLYSKIGVPLDVPAVLLPLDETLAYAAQPKIPGKNKLRLVK